MKTLTRNTVTVGLAGIGVGTLKINFMKTTMQEAIEYLREYKLLSAAIILEDIFLPKEKQQILSSYDAGKEQPSNSQQCPIDYFNNTFNP